jgi:hypothetical protein
MAKFAVTIIIQHENGDHSGKGWEIDEEQTQNLETYLTMLFGPPVLAITGDNPKLVSE